VQYTQQSSPSGVRITWQFSHLYFIWQTSVGRVSVFLCPQCGQVISQVSDFVVLLGDSVLSATLFATGESLVLIEEAQLLINKAIRRNVIGGIVLYKLVILF
jgi:hypothetical protein